MLQVRQSRTYKQGLHLKIEKRKCLPICSLLYLQGRRTSGQGLSRQPKGPLSKRGWLRLLWKRRTPKKRLPTQGGEGHGPGGEGGNHRQRLGRGAHDASWQVQEDEGEESCQSCCFLTRLYLKCKKCWDSYHLKNI